MNKKELKNRMKDILDSGIKKILISDEFREFINITKQLPNRSVWITWVIYLIGFMFMPRVLLLYYTYRFMRFVVKITMNIIKIEKEENIKIMG